jgi:hypothetical protein
MIGNIDHKRPIIPAAALKATCRDGILRGQSCRQGPQG